MPRWVLVVGGVAIVCLFAGLLVANFAGGETKIERRIEPLYALDDPRYMHELGVLLGPPFLQGTKVRALLDGDEIFPPMLAAIRAGRFVSSCGPAIETLEARGPEVAVTCSPARFIRLVGPAHRGQRVAAADGQSLTRATFVVPEDWAHARIEVEDDRGLRAWTNALFA